MRTRWAVGVIAGIILGLGAVMAIEASTDDASAQSGFTVTPAQLQINQKISQAAVRRSNRSLNYLAPIRTSQTDAADSGNDGVKPLSSIPGSGQGWQSNQIADGAITTSKVSDGAVTAAKLESGLAARLPLTAVVSDSGALVRGRGATGAQDAGGSFFTVDFDRNVRECVYEATIGGTGTSYGGVGEISVYSHPTRLNTVVVTTHDSAGAFTNRPFHLTVLC